MAYAADPGLQEIIKGEWIGRVAALQSVGAALLGRRGNEQETGADGERRQPAGEISGEAGWVVRRLAPAWLEPLETS